MLKSKSEEVAALEDGEEGDGAGRRDGENRVCGRKRLGARMRVFVVV